MRKTLLLTVFLLFAILNARAQHTDSQTRIIVHHQVDLGKNIFLANWVIGNGQYYGTNNLNLFEGIGYRGKNRWLEVMLQKQWNPKGNKLLLDTRFQSQLGKQVSLYAEVAPFLNKAKRGSVYQMIIVNYQAWHKFNVGGETEGVDKFQGLGPRIALPFGTLAGYQVSGSLAYQFRPLERDVFRFYLVFNRRFQ